MAIGKHLSDANPDGTCMGQSATDLIGFYGATPVTRPASSAQGAVTTGASTAVTVTSTSISTTGVVAGFQTTGQVTALQTAVNDLITRMDAVGVLANANRVAMVNLGLIKGAA